MTIGFDPAPLGPGEKPVFPPLLRGVEVRRGVDPFEKARADAAAGRADTGDLYWSPDVDVLRATVVFNPEEPLEQAATILFAAACALNDCIGALAPPEVGLEHVWPDGVKVNGAWCGASAMDADTRDPGAVPGWLVVGLALSIRWPGGDPGGSPDVTALSEEGCGHLDPARILESWSRHLLVWVNRWEEDGFRPVCDAWLERAEGRDSDVAFGHGGALQRGRFLGLDEAGGMLLRTDAGTEALPLLAMLDQRRQWPPEEAPERSS